LAPCTGMDKANARAMQITLVDIFSEFIIVKSFLLCGCNVVKKIRVPLSTHGSY
jgi:hypothetical protein